MHRDFIHKQMGQFTPLFGCGGLVGLVKQFEAVFGAACGYGVMLQFLEGGALGLHLAVELVAEQFEVAQALLDGRRVAAFGQEVNEVLELAVGFGSGFQSGAQLVLVSLHLSFVGAVVLGYNCFKQPLVFGERSQAVGDDAFQFVRVHSTDVAAAVVAVSEADVIAIVSGAAA